MYGDGASRRAFLGASLLTLVIGVSVAPSAHATSVVALDLAELARASDALVLATVGESTPADQRGRVRTDTTLQGERVLGGEAPRALSVRQASGQRGDIFYGVPGDAALQRGQRVVAFVREVRGQWYLTALAQSVWYVDGKGDDAAIRRDLSGLSLFRRDARGRTVPADESLPAPDTLGALQTACRDLTFGGER